MNGALVVDDVFLPYEWPSAVECAEILRQTEASEYATWGLAFGRIPAVPPASPDRKMLLDGLAELIARDFLRKRGALVLDDGRVYGGR